jgi:hypothetical protein
MIVTRKHIVNVKLTVIFAGVLFCAGWHCSLALAQTPTIFDVSDVVVGASRIETRYLFAEGKWSDSGGDDASDSTNIQCYKRLGFCDVASAHMLGGQAHVSLFAYDILRWDDKEMIAVDSSPVCVVNTLRADLISKRITLSTTDKDASNRLCKTMIGTPQTAFLLGFKDVIKTITSKDPKK